METQKQEELDLGITNQDIENFFWLAKENGWASGKAKVEINPLNPNRKRIVFESSKFTYVDEYWVTPVSNKSVGTATILYEFEGVLIPVWWMSFAGEYQKEVIPFLKLALCENIRLKKFEGGRGKNHFKYRKCLNHTYHNKWKGSFSNFSGKEWIFISGRGLKGFVGEHNYQGMSLL